jgi:hypothetical protein
MAPVAASTIQRPTFAELVDRADRIFVGTVVDQRSRWVDTRKARLIVTEVVFDVQRTLKGGGGPSVLLEFVGGTLGSEALKVPGVPVFQIGDESVLFVTNGFSISPVVGMMHGRFRISRDPVTREAFVLSHDGRAFSSVTQLTRGIPAFSAAPLPPMPLADFERVVRTRLDR